MFTVRASLLPRAAATLLAVAAALLVCPAAFAAHPALERARALFSGSEVHARGSATAGDPHAATLVLRDLRVALPRLTAAERAEAELLLGRPTNDYDPEEPGWGSGYSERLCDAHICVHWVEDGPDAPRLADGNASGAPDWVETTLAVFAQTWATEVGELGYRAPLSDAESFENGGDGRLDIYLADVGAEALFGWCTSDDPASYATYRVSAFCVIDEDYTNRAFGIDPLPALKATAAHEFFHAIQFGYDWLEDLWLMEGTAAWIEDEVFDGVNDNLRYARKHSPIVSPGTPVDLGRGGYEYGAWIFWRYLSERFGPGLVKTVWNRAAETESANSFSLAATRGALAARGRSFRDVFAGFGAANVTPASSYEEGGAYPAHPVSAVAVRSSVGPHTVSVKRLANRTVAFRPAGGGKNLRIDLAVSSRTYGAATVIVRRESGAITKRRVRFDSKGRASVMVPFGDREVRRVELVLTNADTRLDCWKGTTVSCGGVAHGALRFAYQALVL